MTATDGQITGTYKNEYHKYTNKQNIQHWGDLNIEYGHYITLPKQQD